MACPANLGNVNQKCANCLPNKWIWSTQWSIRRSQLGMWQTASFTWYKRNKRMKTLNFLTGNGNRPLVLSVNSSSEGRAVQALLNLFYLNSIFLHPDTIIYFFPGGATASFFLKSLPLVSYAQHCPFFRNVDWKWNIKQLEILETNAKASIRRQDAVCVPILRSAKINMKVVRHTSSVSLPCS